MSTLNRDTRAEMAKLNILSRLIIATGSFSIFYLIIAYIAFTRGIWLISLNFSGVEIVLPVLSFVVLIIVLTLYFLTSYIIRKAAIRGSETREVESYKIQNKTYLFHILPYAGMIIGIEFSDFDTLVIFGILILVAISILIKSEILYINPLMWIFGYHVYLVAFEREEAYVFSKNDLRDSLSPLTTGSADSVQIRVVQIGRGNYISPK